MTKPTSQPTNQLVSSNSAIFILKDKSYIQISPTSPIFLVNWLTYGIIKHLFANRLMDLISPSGKSTD